ncbi:hypothetical protein [Pyrobaculum sp.]
MKYPPALGAFEDLRERLQATRVGVEAGAAKGFSVEGSKFSGG